MLLCVPAAQYSFGNAVISFEGPLAGHWNNLLLIKSIMSHRIGGLGDFTRVGICSKI